MNRSTLRMCPPNLRSETLRSFERRLGKAVEEAEACVDIAQQLDLGNVAINLREARSTIEATRICVGSAR